MSPEYFQLINELLSTIEDEAPWADQVNQFHQLEKDMDFLVLFCSFLQIWDCTFDEQSRKRLSSTTTALKVIWEKEHKGQSFINHITETWPVDLQNFHSVLFELEANILQSKLQVEGWCGYFVRCAIQYNKSPMDNDLIRPFLCSLQNILDRFSSDRAYKIIPFKNQIDMLIDKVEFLNEFLEENLEDCIDNNTKDRLQFMKFASDFTNNAICLACLYWAKNPNEENAIEMNIILFDMLQKFIHYAPDVIASYIGILNFQPSDSILLEDMIASIVDMFFDHNGFLILRDPLILLFTSLADPPPGENAEHLVRGQIDSLYHEHDFFDKNMLLSDFMIKTEMANANIKQLYSSEFSDSWINLEGNKIDYIYFVSVHRELSWIDKHVYLKDKCQLQLYMMELRFMRVFFLCFATWDDTDQEIKERFSSMITSIQGIWRKEEEEKGLLATRLYAICCRDTENWHLLASELEGKIQQSKQEIEAWLFNLLTCSFGCKHSTSNEILKCLDSIIRNLNDLVSHKAGCIVPFMQQIETLEEKLVFVRNMLKLTTNCIDSKELGEFNMFVQVFANDAACLTFLYWVKDADDKLATETNLMLSRMLQKIKPAMPDVARLYFGTLKTLYLQQCDSLLFGQTASIFLDFFLDDLVNPLQDDFKILHDEVIFLLTFLNDPPNRNAGEVICTYIDDHFWEDVIGLLPFDDTEENFAKKKMLLGDFMMKIEIVNANIRQLYCKFPDLSSYNFPNIMAPGFLDFLIQNLRNLKNRQISDCTFAPFAKYKIIKFVEVLVSLTPLFNHIFKLQNDTLLQVVDLVYLSEHVIYSCISSWFIFDRPIWYHMGYLSDIIDKVEVFRTQLVKAKEYNTHNSRCLPHSSSVTDTPLKQARISQISEVVVGFEDEVEKIVGDLTRGHKSLDIVSVVGMGGLGKTTLAKKVYESSPVKYHFNVFAFCSVSQDHNPRRMLIDILSDIMVVDDRISHMTKYDLAHQLWKCLSRQSYLIVLDDVWNISAWIEIKSSFPDDQNGSRVLITSRSHEVAEKCKIKCSPHRLRFLSDVETWDLLQKKVFHNGISPPNLHDIGKLIARKCKGLPLAVIVIAGLLARTEKNPKWWSEVSEKVGSYLSDSDDGCMKILELSYNHLPENLKPCLLYLGAFLEDILIKVKHVVLLWIAEGFIQESKTKSIENVAKEYFHDLVDRSLVIVNTRSSNGEIKTFRVHDLIHQLCQTKSRERNFFQLNHGIASSSYLDPSTNNQYRVSMQKHSNVNNIAAGSSLSNVSSLLFFRKGRDDEISDFSLRKFRTVKVLDLDLIWKDCDVKQLSSMVHLRHINATVERLQFVPTSISNLWNIVSLMLSSRAGDGKIHLPEAFWRMKSLRHVKVNKCILKFSDNHDHQASYPKLDNVVCFSKPVLSSGKDVHCLLQRLPAVQQLSFFVECYDEQSVETLDFYRKLELLKIVQLGKRSPYLINYPSTLKKLTLNRFMLPCTAISAIAELQCLQVLKLKHISFQGPKWEMEDVSITNLEFLELSAWDLVQWNASVESFPCLKQLLIECQKLEELPACFNEISTLKRISVRYSSNVESSALQIREEQMELGNEIEVSILQ